MEFFDVIGGTTSTGYRKEFSKNRFILTVRIDFEIRILCDIETKKVSQAELTEEQRLFLDEKLSSNKFYRSVNLNKKI